jgi:hypothetical protein
MAALGQSVEKNSTDCEVSGIYGVCERVNLKAEALVPRRGLSGRTLLTAPIGGFRIEESPVAELYARTSQSCGVVTHS